MIKSLQVGRGVAASMVVVHHAAQAARAFGGRDIPAGELFERFYLGVDFFFVLSGFIIYHTVVGAGRSATEYASARFRRVYLPYAPIGIGMACVYAAMPKLSAAAARDWGWFATLTLAPVEQDPALSVAWTLKHELLFYVLFGVGHFGGQLPAVLGVWTAAILLAAATGRTPPGCEVALSPMNLEFMMGAAVAVVFRSPRGRSGWLLAPAALALGSWAALGCDRDLSPLVGLGIALALVPLLRYEVRNLTSVPPTLMLLGDASYAMYLVHNPIISVTSRLARPLGAEGILVASTLSGVLGGLAYHVLVERPILRAARPSAREPARATGTTEGA